VDQFKGAGHSLDVFKRYNSFLEGMKDAAVSSNTYLTLAHESKNSEVCKPAIN